MKSVQWAWWAALVVVTLLVCLNTFQIQGPLMFTKYPAMEVDPIDTPLILHAVASKPTWVSTFAWWHTSWYPQAPYWRPLTMQTFWLESHLLGSDRFDRWSTVGTVFHLISVTLFGWFAYLLTGRRSIALLSVALFAAWRPIESIGDLNMYAPADVTIGRWKDQPDLFADTFLFLTLILTMRKRYVPAIVTAIVATAYKESGWMAWVTALLVLLSTGNYRTVPKRIYGWAIGIVMVMVAMRASAGWAVMYGYHLGHEHNGLTRYMYAVANWYCCVMVQFPIAFEVANLILVAMWLRRKSAPLSYATFAGGFCLILLIWAHTMQQPLAVAVAAFTDPGMLVRIAADAAAVVFTAWCLGAALLSRYRLQAVFTILSILATALPYVAAVQVGEHALRQSYAFQCLLAAIGTVSMIDVARNTPAEKPAGESATAVCLHSAAAAQK